MRFVADEGLDAPIVVALRNEGHEVYYIKEEHPGSSDEEVLKIANDRGDILIASDKDFGELVYRLKQIHSGILLLRLSGVKPKEKATIVSSAVREHGNELHHAFTVINKTHVKIRK
jgi:predicted nuclease of predicted toxin-antitoxin system